jgi:hypothetical protein
VFPTSYALALCCADPHGVVDQRSRALSGLRYKVQCPPRMFELHRKLTSRRPLCSNTTLTAIAQRELSVRCTSTQQIAIMAKFDMAGVWRDIVTYRRAYLLTVVASFGGMVSRSVQHVLHC